MFFASMLSILVATGGFTADQPSRGMRFFFRPPQSYCGYSFDLPQKNPGGILRKLVALKATGNASFVISYIDFRTLSTVEIADDCESIARNQAVTLLRAQTGSPGNPIQFQSLSFDAFVQTHLHDVAVVMPWPPHNPFQGVPNDCVLELASADFDKPLHTMTEYGVPIIDSVQTQIKGKDTRSFMALGMQCDARENIRAFVRDVVPRLTE